MILSPPPTGHWRRKVCRFVLVEEAKPLHSGGARTILGYWLVKHVEQRRAANYPQANVVDPIHEALLKRLMDRMLNTTRPSGPDTCFSMAWNGCWKPRRCRPAPGIVTNKQSRFTDPLAEALKLTSRAHCIISGDTTAEAKPHPLPLADRQRAPGVSVLKRCVYIGDAARATSRPASEPAWRPWRALYGYIAADDAMSDAWGRG
jgi:hypothetical protein